MKVRKATVEDSASAIFVAEQRSGRSTAGSRLHALEEAFSSRDGLPAASQLLVFAMVVLAMFSRRPALFLHAQFYAEDGFAWYAEAYNAGWLHSLTLVEGGYLNTLQRLVAGVALWVPLRWAPLLMAVGGLLLQVLPVTVLLSARCRSWGPLALRSLFAAIYVALPNALEIHVVLTNAQWHLALTLVLVAFAEPPEGWAGRAFDICLFLIGSVSGPFCIVLLPLLLVHGWLRRQRWWMALAFIAAPGVLLQGYLIVTHPRSGIVLGATPVLFLRLLGGHVFVASIFGSSGLASWHGVIPLILTLLGDVFGIALMVYAWRFLKPAMRFLIVFSVLIFVASLHAPLFSGDVPLWQQLAIDGGGRYWFLPMLSFLWSGAWCARYAPARGVRVGAVVMFCLMPIGVARNWYHRGFADKHFSMYAAEFQREQPGEHLVIPIVPFDLTMELVKK